MRNKLGYTALMHCKVCQHSSRDTIDQRIVNGTALRSICTAFNLSLGSLHRHKEQHLKRELADAMRSSQSARAEHGGDLLSRVLRLAGEAEAILESAKGTKDFKGATAAICAAVRCLELCGRLDGSLAQPNAPGLHLHMTSTKVTVNNYGDDREIALLIAEATRNFDPEELTRLKTVAESTSVQRA
jgi:hypothetical protein